MERGALGKPPGLPQVKEKKNYFKSAKIGILKTSRGEFKYPWKKVFTPPPPHNGHFSTTVTFLLPKVGLVERVHCNLKGHSHQDLVLRTSISNKGIGSYLTLIKCTVLVTKVVDNCRGYGRAGKKWSVGLNFSSLIMFFFLIMFLEGKSIKVISSSLRD